MPEDVFWRGSIPAFWAYEHARSARGRERNEFAWMQGLYFYQALNATMSSVIGKRKIDYPDKPSGMERRSKADEEKLQRTTDMIRQHNMIIHAKLSGKH